MTATILVASALLSVPAAALAATPSPTPTDATSTQVVYTGGGFITTDDARFNKLIEPHTFPSTFTFDCSSSPCRVDLTIIDDADPGDLAFNLAHVPVAAVGTPQRIPASGGTLCDDGFVPAGAFTITSVGGTLTAVRSFDLVGEIDCPDGSATSIPAGYRMELTATLAWGRACLLDRSCPTPTPVPTATPTLAPAAAGGIRVTPHAVALADPSTLSTLPTVATSFAPANIIWAAAATVVLVLLIALPSHLLNTATESGSDRFSEWWKGVRARRLTAAVPVPAETAPVANAAPPHPVNYRGWPIAAAGVLAASLISSFIDPSFGFNPGSVRVFLSIVLSFLLDAVAGWFLLILLVRRANPGATASFRFAPATLIIVAIAVLFTRLTGFQPGIVFGLVAGVVFGAVLATAEKGRLALVTLGYSFLLAVVGWIGYSALTSAVAHPSAPLVFVEETFSAMAIGGIAALPIALVPLRGLAGHDLWTWNRWIWAGAYGIGLLGFFIVLMPKPFSWQSVNLSVWVWGGIYAAYALLAVGAWLLIVRPWRRGETGGSETTAGEKAEKPEMVETEPA